MELRDYSDIFRKQEKVFLVTVFLCVLAVIVWQKSQGTEYQATLLLNIGRAGVQSTQDYTYDGFYRLQADERFADTVVRWLGSPRVVEDIYSATNLDAQKRSVRNLKSVFGAKRLSSQVIEVTYTDANIEALKKIADATTATLNRYTDSLNKENKEVNWFVVIGNDPVISDARVPFLPSVAVGLIFGVFIGFWAALIRHYLADDKNRQQ